MLLLGTWPRISAIAAIQPRTTETSIIEASLSTVLDTNSVQTPRREFCDRYRDFCLIVPSTGPTGKHTLIPARSNPMTENNISYAGVFCLTSINVITHRITDDPQTVVKTRSSRSVQVPSIGIPPELHNLWDKVAATLQCTCQNGLRIFDDKPTPANCLGSRRPSTTAAMVHSYR